MLLAHVPENAHRILDLGTGDGRLLALLLIDRPHASGVALDFSPMMLQKVRERFAGNPQIAVVAYNWIRTVGFADVDCYWKWLELALLVGVKPIK